ncbi:hypothetical protein [Actinomadura sp. 3N508]|uniref:hypothetical protein n=1 Tax=Actinomadura sp. 3N508 TaxID=3375153 RepID=UPI0037985697
MQMKDLIAAARECAAEAAAGAAQSQRRPVVQLLYHALGQTGPQTLGPAHGHSIQPRRRDLYPPGLNRYQKNRPAALPAPVSRSMITRPRRSGNGDQDTFSAGPRPSSPQPLVKREDDAKHYDDRDR